MDFANGDLFKNHTAEDAESLFIVGTPYTTPKLSEQENHIPHPWLFARVLAIVFLLYLGFFAGLFLFGNVNFLPGLIMFGAFLVPVSILILFWEINVPKNISIYRVVIFFLVGGLVSLLYTVVLYSFIDGYSVPLFIGFIEETAKLLALLIFVPRIRYKYIMNGLLIGAAVGAGFSAFESSGYIFLTALQYGVKTMLDTTFWRAILAPGGHIAWAALMGAAAVLVKKEEIFKFRRLFKFRFLGIYLTVALLHTLWDSDIPQPFLPNIPVYPFVLTLLSWSLLLLMVKKGIRQISEIVRANTEAAETV